DGSFTLLKPTIAVVTNVEPEHLENYDNSESELWRAFGIFVKQAKTSVLNLDDEGLEEHFIDDSYSDGTFSLFYFAENIRPRPALAIPGEHNLSNAAAAMATVD